MSVTGYMYNINAKKKLGQVELDEGLEGNRSWHHQFKDSAYIYVGGLHPKMTEGDFVIVFSQFGEIIDVNLVRDKNTGISKGFGFICYEDQRSTVLAVDGVPVEDFGPEENQYRFKVTLWKNGFSVNNGPLRVGETPADQAFLSSIHEKRECPAELMAEAAGKEPVVDLIDKRGQEYEAPPKPKYTAFGGAGQSLCNSTAAPVIDQSAPVVASDYKLELDESQKTTKLQLQFHDGSKMVQKFNLSHTVLDIRLFMESQKPLPMGTCFELCTTYPTATLSDYSVTIEVIKALGIIAGRWHGSVFEWW